MEYSQIAANDIDLLKEFELANVLRNNMSRAALEKLDLAVFDDDEISTLYDVFDDVLKKTPHFRDQVVIARSARNLKPNSIVWVARDTEEENIPIFFLILQLLGDNVVFIDKIWKSVYGTILMEHYDYYPTAFKGQAFALIQHAIQDDDTIKNRQYGVRQAATEGSRKMFVRAGVELHPIDEFDTKMTPYDVRRLMSNSNPLQLREWFALSDIVKPSDNDDDPRPKRIKQCIVCNEKARYQCVECTSNYYYCSIQCHTSIN